MFRYHHGNIKFKFKSETLKKEEIFKRNWKENLNSDLDNVEMNNDTAIIRAISNQLRTLGFSGKYSYARGANAYLFTNGESSFELLISEKASEKINGLIR